MTTTPTLYVKGKSEWFNDSNGEPAFVLNHRSATHDELIAAMPRCGTCDRWRALEQGTELGICRVVDTTVSVVVGKDFGCRRHKERNNG